MPVNRSERRVLICRRSLKNAQGGKTICSPILRRRSKPHLLCDVKRQSIDQLFQDGPLAVDSRTSTILRLIVVNVVMGRAGHCPQNTLRRILRYAIYGNYRKMREK